MKALSIVIPTLNEEAYVSQTLSHLAALNLRDAEVIVVDAGSKDNTLEIVGNFSVKVVKTKQAGRAHQMHEGVLASSGRYICFLHADTLTPSNLQEIIEKTLSRKSVVMGGFVSLMQGKKTRYWFSFLNYIKTYLCPLFYRPLSFFGKGLKLLFGDQVMFCRRADYLRSGGFDTEVTVMEEAGLCLKLNRFGQIKMVHQLVYSSDRRVSEWGFWKSNRIYFYITFGWAIGLSNAKLERLYTHIR